MGALFLREQVLLFDRYQNQSLIKMGLNIVIQILLGVFCMLLTGCVADGINLKDGYIFTCSRNIKNGGTNEMYLRRFGNLNKGVLQIELTYMNYTSNKREAIVSKLFDIPEGEKDTNMSLTLETKDFLSSPELQINGTFGDYKVFGKVSVDVTQAKNSIIIVQTDKSLYKPGQTVKFRILKVNKHFKISKENNIADVFIDDPKGTRLFEFKKLNLDKGLVQEEFLLSDEPVFGSWSIKVVFNETSIFQQFDVKEYVLPKFDVKIELPPYVLSSADFIPVTVCANYTYDKPVVGTLNLTAGFSYYFYRNQELLVKETVKIDGCYSYVINVTKIENGTGYTSYSNIKVVAIVTEEGTGVQKESSKYISRSTTSFKLSFIDGLDYFKAGLPYFGTLKVSNLDDTTAAEESVEICVVINKKRIIANWWATKTIKICKKYTSDENGLVKYVIEPQNIDVISMNLEARTLNLVRNSSTSGRANSLEQSEASKDLNPFYSPSGSFLQIQPVHQPISCGSLQPLKLLFTSKNNANYTFFYQVMWQNLVVFDDFFDVSFSTKASVNKLFENNAQVIEGNETQIDPPLEDITKDLKDVCPEAKESRISVPIGEAIFEVDVKKSYSLTIYVLVYYVREDGEVVADSMKLNIEECLPNKVEISFGDAVQQPGANTTLLIKSGANSLCGTKAIDKSVLLLSSNDELSISKVFQKLADLDENQYNSENLCYNDGIQPGLEKADIKSLDSIFPQGIGSSFNQDSLSAFQLSGIAVISDLFIFNRPCTSSYQGYDYSVGELQGPAGKPIRIMPSGSAPRSGTVNTPLAFDARMDFPETWLFELEMTRDDGTLEKNVTLPDTITEWVGSAVCINLDDGLGISNTTSITAFQPFFIEYTLPVSVIRGEEFILIVSVFSYVEGALPVTIELENVDGFEVVGKTTKKEICIVKSESKVDVSFTLKATKVGKVYILVRAETSKTSKACKDSDVSIMYAKDAVNKTIEIEAEGFPEEIVISNLLCPFDNSNDVANATIGLTLPSDSVPDSAKAYLDITGNILGPAINNLNNLISLPTESGELNMVNFVPNYLVLDYLSDIGALENGLKNKAIGNLRTGYYHELSFRHSDGSFSVFGSFDRTGSMFLTAFVLRSFYEAKQYIYINDNIVKQMQNWILSKQATNGCFPNIGQIINIYTPGGLQGDNSTGSITAYVLASLLISKFDNKTIIDDAFNCLKENPPISPYDDFLYAYVNVLAGYTEEAKHFVEKAKKEVVEKDGMAFFKIEKSSISIEVETNAYAVLTTLALGGSVIEVLPYVRFLIANLNANGGFSSSQDTCVGLEAMSKFAKASFRNELDLVVETSGGLKETVKISKKSVTLVHRFKITDIEKKIGIEAKGSGCALTQASLRYNAKTLPDTKTYSLDIRGECLDPLCNEATLDVLVSYIPSGKVVGLSILEVKLISGFAAVKDSLAKLKADESNHVIRTDIEQNTVIFYLSEISNKLEKFSIEVVQIVKVQNAQLGTARIYDYYDNENSASTSYKTDDFKPDIKIA